MTDYHKFSDAGQLQPLVDLLFEKIYPHGVQQCIKSSTHSWQSSCIDHVYTNSPEKIAEVKVNNRGSSDHKLILVTRNSRSMKQNIRYCKRRSYKYFSEVQFLREVEKISWWEVYACQDVDVAVHVFTRRLTDILDRMAPVRKFQIRRNYAPWISDKAKG